MTDKELMQQALDALKQSTPDQRVGDDDYCEQAFKEHLEAITALRSRLEQPVIAPEWAIPPKETPQQKPWVGLTDDEIKGIIGSWGDTPIKGYTRKLFDQIETKLKEKNYD
jgi:hypothetical protein